MWVLPGGACGTSIIGAAASIGYVQLIGLTGGIASGKSTVSARLRDLGAVIVDADVLAREVVAPGTPGLSAIAEHFGSEVLSADGTLNRPALGALVFGHPEQLAALNAITHPAVWARARELFAAAEAADPDAIVVYDVPLLVEASEGRPMRFDAIVVVDATREVREQRLVEQRGMSPTDAAHRIGSQASDADRLAIADVVLDNNGTPEQLREAVDALWAKLTHAVGGTA
jgi:dephospho-CoA kinase